MVKVKKLNRGYKVYSTEHKLIKNLTTGEVHSEYKVKDEPDLNIYEEVIDTPKVDELMY